MSKSVNDRQDLQRERQDSNWAKMALSAKPLLAPLRHGERERGLKEAAANLGVTAQTLRRAVSALEFLEISKFKINLKAAPLAAVEAVRRWSQYDREAAIRAAERVLAGGTVEWIIEEERKARLAKGAKLPATPSIQGDYIAVAMRYFQIKFPEMVCEVQKKNRPNNIRRLKPPANLICYERWTENIVATATLVPNDFDAPYYINRVVRSLMQAIALERIYGNAFVMCPDVDTFDTCLEWMNYYVKDCKIKFVVCFPEYLDNEKLEARIPVRVRLDKL